MKREASAVSDQTSARWLGGYEIVMGVLGLVVTAWVIVQNQRGLVDGGVAVSGVLFSALVVAGVLLVRSPADGFRMSVPLQLAQAVSLVVPGIVWKFNAGPQLVLYFGSDRLNLQAGMDFSLMFGAPDSVALGAVGLNLVPIVLLLYFARLRHRTIGGITQEG